MSDVFAYFFSIGSGLAMGIAIIALPGIWIIKKLPGGKKDNAQY